MCCPEQKVIVNNHLIKEFSLVFFPWHIFVIFETGLNKYYPPFPPHSSIVLSYLGRWIIHLLTANNAKEKKLMKTLLSNGY